MSAGQVCRQLQAKGGAGDIALFMCGGVGCLQNVQPLLAARSDRLSVAWLAVRCAPQGRPVSLCCVLSVLRRLGWVATQPEAFTICPMVLAS